jgi:hypothetical protein
MNREFFSHSRLKPVVMKNLLLGMLVVFLVGSCTTDENGTVGYNTDNTLIDKGNQKDAPPANAVNPFDAVGKRYGNWLSEYYLINGNPKAADGLTVQVNYMSKKLKGQYDFGKSTIVVTEKDINVIVSSPTATISSFLEKSTLGEAAQFSLLQFFTNLINEKEEEYAVLYDFIVTYEAGVVDSSWLTAEEEETILGITSVTRYALDAEGGHKDRDWEISVGHKFVKPQFYPFQAPLVSVIAHLPHYLVK